VLDALRELGRFWDWVGPLWEAPSKLQLEPRSKVGLQRGLGHGPGGGAPLEVGDVRVLLLRPDHLSECKPLPIRQRQELSGRHVQREVDLARG
jgi:hypothetical protein